MYLLVVLTPAKIRQEIVEVRHKRSLEILLLNLPVEQLKHWGVRLAKY